jgi:type IV pilus assembly protein PilF
MRLAAVTALTVQVAACAGSPPRDPESDAARLAEINLQLGVGYMEEGDPQRAVDRLRRSIDARPTGDAYLALAVVYERLGQPEAAETQFREALRLAPELPAAHTNYGSFLCKAGRVEEAEQHFQKAVTIPGYANAEVAYTNAAVCVGQHGAPERADEYLRKALEVNPRFSPALLALAERAMETGDAGAARGYLERYLDIAPPSPRSLSLGVRVEEALGNRQGAATYRQILSQRFPGAPETQQLEARARRR